MKKFHWRDLAEIIGHVTIVAGLIFVGLQLNQSQEIAIASQYQARAAAAVEYNGAQMQNTLGITEKGAEIIAFAKSDDATAELKEFVKDRSPESVGMWLHENRVFFTMIDNFHYQYVSGFMDEEAWIAFEQQLRKEMAKQSTAAYYKNVAFVPRASFGELCDEILEDIDNSR